MPKDQALLEWKYMCWTQKKSTLPKTNMAPENRPSQKEGIVFQPSIFRCYVSFREGNQRFKPTQTWPKKN